MLTQEQIDEQQAFERGQIRGGLDKLRKNTDKLEEKIYASATVYGSACVTGIMPDLIAYIDEKKEKYKSSAGRDMDIIVRYIVPVMTEVQALLTCKVVFDHVFAPRQKQQAITTTALAVGAACEAECQMNYYEQEAPALLATLKRNYWHQAKGTEYKRKSIQTLMHKPVSYTHLTLPTIYSV